MEEILKQDRSESHKEFEKLLSEDLNNRKLKEGEVITGVVSTIGEKHIFIDISAKSEGVIPIEEFKLTKEIDKIKVGSKIEVLLEKIEIRTMGSLYKKNGQKECIFLVQRARRAEKSRF